MSPPHNAFVDYIVTRLAGIDAPRVLEIGTMRSKPDVPTHHKDWALHASDYVMADMQQGADVDVIADVHALHETFRPKSFDVVIACSVMEHVARPWVAFCSIAHVLAHGGVLVIDSHQTYPVHGYPDDYWRFTTNAYEVLCEDAGMAVEWNQYAFPCTIVVPPEITGWNAAAPAYLHTQLVAHRR